MMSQLYAEIPDKDLRYKDMGQEPYSDRSIVEKEFDSIINHMVCVCVCTRAP